MNKRNRGKCLVILGTVLIVFSMLFAGYNIHEDIRAGQAAKLITRKVQALSVNTGTNHSAEPASVETVQVEGKSYIGTISIPVLGLDLPVMDSWSMANLKIAPCLYQGTVQENNMIICAHAYRNYFGRIHTLSIGDEITFKDVNDAVTNYQVTEVTLLQASQVQEMTEGDWDLTLFTCNFAGDARVTVRCDKLST